MKDYRFRPPDPEDDFNAKQQFDDFDLENHASLAEGIIELRRVYNEEEERRKSLESKNGGLIAVNGVVLSLLQLSTTNQSFPIVDAVVLLLFIFSTVLCLWNVLPKGYEKPFALKEYPRFTNKKLNKFQSRQYSRYFLSIKYNREYNNYRYTWFTVSFSMTALAIVVVGANSLIPFAVGL
jgi:hypothetical protein